MITQTHWTERSQAGFTYHHYGDIVAGPETSAIYAVNTLIECEIWGVTVVVLQKDGGAYMGRIAPC